MSVTLLCLSLSLGAKPEPYPRAELLVEPEFLLKRLNETIILDTRTAKAYDEGHIPGAIRVDAGEWSKSFNTQNDAKTWGSILGRLGITESSAVVVYGESWTDAARVWWILRQWGVNDARLMNGPFAVWKTAGGKVSTETPKPNEIASQFRAAKRLATKDDVLDILKDKSAQILDVRTEAEHCGNEGTAKKKGSIPGAAHLDWNEFVDPKTKKLKPADEISKLLEKAGIDPKKPVVTYCQSGGRASVGAFVLELMGGEKVRNYYRSWAEWGNADDTPVVKPEKK